MKKQGKTLLEYVVLGALVLCLVFATVPGFSQARGGFNTFGRYLRQFATHLWPSGDNMWDLGSASKRMRNGYFGNDLSVTKGLTATTINNVIYVDGTTYARTSTGIQAAIDTVSTGSAATVILTDGTYDMTSTVTWTDKGITLEGLASTQGTSLGAYLVTNSSFASGPMFQPVQSNSYSFSAKPSSHFANLHITANGDNDITAGIHTSGFVHGTIKNCVINGFDGAATSAGIILDTATGSPVTNVLIEHCYISNNANDIRLADTGDSYRTQVVVRDTWLSKPSTDTGTMLYSDNIASNANRIKFDTCYFEANSDMNNQNGIYSAGGKLQVKAVNCKFDILSTNSYWDLSNVTDTLPSMFLGCDFASTGTPYTNQTDNEPIILDSTTGDFDTKRLNIIDSNITYVPVGENIETYIIAATAGDTLVLASGTYTLTSDIEITKAINIIGQGKKSTILAYTTTAGDTVFNSAVDGVNIANLSIDMTGNTSTATAISFDGAAGTILSNCNLYNVNIDIDTTTTSLYAVYYRDAGGIIENLTVNMSGVPATKNGFGVYMRNEATAEAATALKVYNSDVIVTSDGSTSASYYVSDGSATQDAIMYLYNSKGKISGSSSGMYGIDTNGGDAYAYAEGCTFDGGTYDAYQQSTGTTSLTNCVLVNGTTSGTITYAGTTVTKDITASGEITTNTLAMGGNIDLATHNLINAGRINSDGILYLEKTSDVSSGDAFYFRQSSSSNELTSSNAQQSYMYISPSVKQTNTAAFDALRINVADSESYGDGSSGEGNNLIRTQIAGVTKFAVDINGLVRWGVTAGITAGTTQSQGQVPLTASINEVSTCGNTNDVVTLPTAIVGANCIVINNGAETLQIFPASDDDLGAGVNNSTTLAAAANVHFVAYDATNWEVIP